MVEELGGMTRNDQERHLQFIIYVPFPNQNTNPEKEGPIGLLCKILVFCRPKLVNKTEENRTLFCHEKTGNRTFFV